MSHKKRKNYPLHTAKGERTPTLTRERAPRGRAVLHV